MARITWKMNRLTINCMALHGKLLCVHMGFPLILFIIFEVVDNV